MYWKNSWMSTFKIYLRKFLTVPFTELDSNKKVTNNTTSSTGNTVVGKTLAVFSLPQILKNCQCLDGQVGNTFLAEITILQRSGCFNTSPTLTLELKCNGYGTF